MRPDVGPSLPLTSLGFFFLLWSALSQNDSMLWRTLSLAVVAAVLCLAARPGPVRPIVCR